MENIEKDMEQPKELQKEIAEANEEKSQFEIDKNEEKNALLESAEGSIGKFKDKDSLITAYNSLQAEFTRKCQKLAELESGKQEAENKISFETSDQIVDFVLGDKELFNKAFKTYFDELQKTKSPTVISNYVGGGIPVNAPPKPKDLDEAREIVKKMFS